ncbi:MAG: hypothetical protein H0W72_05380 [Planctomycetes bacterium]|nr:hypothetical protein [Planctomycetota bacterium]
MTVTAQPVTTRRLRTGTVTTAPMGVDRETGTIRGASAIQTGEALGHGLLIDAIALGQVERLGNAGKAIKVRFNHPGMCNDGLGYLAGHASNFAIDGDKTRCDIVLSQTAKKSPHGDLHGYVLDLAEQHPGDFALSIAFSGYAVWKLADGSEIDVRDESLYVDDGWDGYYRRPDTATSDLPYARVEALGAVDFVDEAAANRDGLFAATFAAHGSAKAGEAYAALDALLSRYQVGIDQAEQLAATYFAARRRTPTTTTSTKDPSMKLSTAALLVLLTAASCPADIACIKEMAEAEKDEGEIRAELAKRERDAQVATLASLRAELGAKDTAHGEAIKAANDKAAALETQLADVQKKHDALAALKSGASRDPGGDHLADPTTGLSGEAKWSAEFKASAKLQEQFALGGEAGYLAFKRDEALKAKVRG